MPLPPSPGRLRKLSKLPQDEPKSRLLGSQSLQNQSQKLYNGENYTPVHSNLQFALNSHIPAKTFTPANLLPIVYGQYPSDHASQLDVDGSLLTDFDDNDCAPDKSCYVDRF